jgi:hypothetical protein
MARRAPRRSLADHVDAYFSLAATVDDVRAGVRADRFLAVRHVDVVADPRATLAGLCRYLGVAVEPDHLDACAAVVFPEARRTRGDVDWTDALLARVDEGVARHGWLAGYRREGGE